jgi:UDP-N-acetylglucosamine 2-epimerase (non-hydrolysing)
VAKKLNIRVVHVEAGLRSFDREMPEEINRVVTDSITDLFLVTEQSGRLNLVKEGIPEERIHLVGNLMIDSLYRHIDTARKSDVIARLHIGEGSYGVVTLHRPSNVDDAAQLCDILSALGEVSRDIPLYFPVHPRTHGRMPENWPGERIHLIEPLGYFDFLCLVLNSAVVFTDSGGIQEETTVLGVPCITIRNNTERPATVEEGTNILAGTSQAGILKAWREVLAAPRAPRVPPLWDGQASSRCRAALRSFFGL